MFLGEKGMHTSAFASNRGRLNRNEEKFRNAFKTQWVQKAKRAAWIIPLKSRLWELAEQSVFLLEPLGIRGSEQSAPAPQSTKFSQELWTWPRGITSTPSSPNLITRRITAEL